MQGFDKTVKNFQVVSRWLAANEGKETCLRSLYEDPQSGFYKDAVALRNLGRVMIRLGMKWHIHRCGLTHSEHKVYHLTQTERAREVLQEKMWGAHRWTYNEKLRALAGVVSTVKGEVMSADQIWAKIPNQNMFRTKSQVSWFLKRLKIQRVNGWMMRTTDEVEKYLK